MIRVTKKREGKEREILGKVRNMVAPNNIFQYRKSESGSFLKNVTKGGRGEGKTLPSRGDCKKQKKKFLLYGRPLLR